MQSILCNQNSYHVKCQEEFKKAIARGCQSFPIIAPNFMKFFSSEDVLAYIRFVIWIQNVGMC